MQDQVQCSRESSPIHCPTIFKLQKTTIFNDSLKLPANPFTMHFPSLLLPLSLALLSSANPIANPAPALEVINLDKRSTYSISLYSKPDFQGDQATFTEEYVVPFIHPRSACVLAHMEEDTSTVTDQSSGSHKISYSGGAQSWIYTSEVDDGCCVAFCRGSTNVGRYVSSLPFLSSEYEVHYLSFEG
jgi:hypothetical protein